MGLLEAVKKVWHRASPADNDGDAQRAAGRPQPDHEDVRVPEVTSGELMHEMNGGGTLGLLLLDCREHFERAQAFIPESLHIPMNSIPQRLDELDRARDIVVYCAHGNRSYGVAGWLNQQGYKARSLKGGIADWQHKHGPVESGYRGRS